MLVSIFGKRSNPTASSDQQLSNSFFILVQNINLFKPLER